MKCKYWRLCDHNFKVQFFKNPFLLYSWSEIQPCVFIFFAYLIFPYWSRIYKNLIKFNLIIKTNHPLPYWERCEHWSSSSLPSWLAAGCRRERCWEKKWQKRNLPIKCYHLHQHYHLHLRHYLRHCHPIQLVNGCRRRRCWENKWQKRNLPTTIFTEKTNDNRGRTTSRSKKGPRHQRLAITTIMSSDHRPYIITRSYAALRAADLGWIVWQGYSSGEYF